MPANFSYEIRNVLVVSERRGRLRPEQSVMFLDALADLAIEVEELPSDGAVIELARGHGMSVYDAAYLELALRRRLALATADGKLREAAEMSGVSAFQMP